MSIDIRWDNEQRTIIRQTFTPGWTWSQFYETGKKATAMMKEVSHTVSIISDFRDSGGLPTGGAVSQAYNAMSNYPSNWGILVVVSDNKFIRALVKLFKNVYVTHLGRKTFTATTLDEAYQRVQDELQSTSSK